MYERYHTETFPVELRSTAIGKFKVIRNESCLNCGRCITLCIYRVHDRLSGDPRKMAEPASLLCKNCFSCIQNCPQHALEMVRCEEFESLGNSYWTPQIIRTIWNEAENGEIPVYGAGYRGRFKGSGFDRIWTDMSEIVRPTRDGIHGREYIATAVDLGRKPLWIKDFEKLDSPRFYEIQTPMLLDSNPSGNSSENIILATIEAASKLRTLAFVDIEDYSDEFEPYLPWIALRCPLDKIDNPALLREVNFIEISLADKYSYFELERGLDELRTQNQKAVISLAVKEPSLPEEILRQFEGKKADALSFHAQSDGRSFDSNLFISESVRSLHTDLVKKGLRDEITLLGKGGIAAAEHVPKLIICGADAVVLDLCLLVSIGCRVCSACQKESCPAGLEKLDRETVRQRMVNMAGAWRDQLLEILSAMGIRDVRRLRGEVGRAMFYEQVEKESFEFMFDRSGRQK